MRSLKGKRGPCGKLCAECPKRHSCENIQEAMNLSEKSPEAKKRKSLRREAELFPNILKPGEKKDWSSVAPAAPKAHPGFFRWLSHQVAGNSHMGEETLAERSKDARGWKGFRRESEKRMGFVPRTKEKSGTGKHPMMRWGSHEQGHQGYEPPPSGQEYHPHLTTQHDLRDPNPAIRSTTRAWIRGKIDVAKRRLAAATPAKPPEAGKIAKSDKTAITRVYQHPEARAEDVHDATSLMAFANQ
jgi:hypothetical protein